MGEKESSLPSPEKCLIKQEFAVRNLMLYVHSFPDCIWEKTTGKLEEKIGISEKTQQMKRQNICFVVAKTPHEQQVTF